MTINVIGECDKRPVLYTLMKICQTLGDVLLVTSSSRLIRLSDTGDTYGHYQNTMIGVTYEGIDDFWDSFQYEIEDFEYTIVDNIVTSDADLTIYVKGLVESEAEEDMLEYIDDVKTIELYRGKLLDANTPYRLEEFEAMRTMCAISQKVAEAVVNVIAQSFKVDKKRLLTIAMAQTSTHMSKLPQPKKPVAERGKISFSKKK